MTQNQSVDLQCWARIAGAAFLFLIGAAVYGEFSLLSDTFVDGDIAATAANIVANEGEYRLAVGLELLAFAGVPILAVALYSLLRQFDESIALLALTLRLAESAIFAAILLNRYVAVELLVANPSNLDSTELVNIVAVYLSAYENGYGIGVVFFSLGSTLFSYLLFKSPYVPSALGILGVVASVVVFIGTFTNIIIPGQPVTVPYAILILVFEVSAGFWLLVRGDGRNKFQTARF